MSIYFGVCICVRLIIVFVECNLRLLVWTKQSVLCLLYVMYHPPHSTPTSQRRSRYCNQWNLSRLPKLTLDEKILNESTSV